MFITFALILIILFQACLSEGDNKKDVVAQVNLAQISNSELEASLSPDTKPESKLALKRKLMEKWIEDEIVYQTAVNEGLTLNEIENMMIKNYEKRLIIEKYLQKYLNVNYKILDQEIEDYYNKHKQEFVWNDEYVNIIHLVIENEDRAIDNEIRKSKNLLDVIKNNFFDQQSTRERPIGDLGYVKLSDLPARLQSRVKTTKTGSIRGPIKTEYGVHYFQLLDVQKADAIKDLELIKDEIILRIKMQKRRNEIDKLKQNLRSNFSIQTDLTNLSKS
jgi:peptidyl-prolyl cis-trans isomerase C